MNSIQAYESTIAINPIRLSKRTELASQTTGETANHGTTLQPENLPNRLICSPCLESLLEPL